VARTSKKPVVTGSTKVAADPVILEDIKAECPEIKKEHIKDRNICKTTFTLPGEAALEAGTVTIVGDFNNWDRDATHLKKLGNGNFAVTVELDAGKEYRFRYLIDGQQWENDWHADKYVKSPYGAEDSVVCT
jgi:1,4-alpha-glucan branching enzyme